MSEIKQIPTHNLEQCDDNPVQKAIKFFREHSYNLPEITQSPEGFALAMDFWLDPQVKEDKMIFSESLAANPTQVIDSGTQWQLYVPSAEDLTKPAPPTNPPSPINVLDNEDELNNLRQLLRNELSEILKNK